jgi:aspartate racemase
VRTIGIVGGFTWMSTADYYRIINEEVSARLGSRHSAQIVLRSVDFEEHLRLQELGGWAAVTEEITGIGRLLRAAGADFLLLTANTLHQVAEPVEAAVGLPVLHITDATAAAIRARGLRTVGLLGTRFTMTGDFWGPRMAGRHGIRVLVPPPEGIREVDRIIYDELAAGRIEARSRQACLREIERLTAAGAEAVVLGCTELQLLIRPGDTPALLFDTLALHARAAAERALAD